MSVTVTVQGHDGSRLNVDVIRYERPEATDEADANWLVARIEVTNGTFSGTVEDSLTTQDFQEFRGQLVKALDVGDGVAEFRTLEEILEVKVTINRLGQANVSGRLRSLDRPSTELSFAFESDQSFLKRTVLDLDAVTNTFPVRPGP
jgi:hypothetical protein